MAGFTQFEGGWCDSAVAWCAGQAIAAAYAGTCNESQQITAALQGRNAAVSSYTILPQNGTFPQTYICDVDSSHTIVACSGITGFSQAMSYAYNSNGVTNPTGGPGFTSQYAAYAFGQGSAAVLARLTQNMPASGRKNVLLTGHSFGGVQAFLLASQIQQSYPQLQVSCIITLGMPPLFDNTFGRGITANKWAVYIPGDAVCAFTRNNANVPVVTTLSNGTQVVQTQALNYILPATIMRLSDDGFRQVSRSQCFDECVGPIGDIRFLIDGPFTDKHNISSYLELLSKHALKLGARGPNGIHADVREVVDHLRLVYAPVNIDINLSVPKSILESLKLQVSGGGPQDWAPLPTMPSGVTVATETRAASSTQIQVRVRQLPNWIQDRQRAYHTHALRGDGHALLAAKEIVKNLNSLLAHDWRVAQGIQRGSYWLGDPSDPTSVYQLYGSQLMDYLQDEITEPTFH